MSVARTYEQITHTGAQLVRGAIDQFAAARITRGRVPPVLGEVNFFITRRLTPPAVTYEPPLELISWTNRSGFFLFSGEVRRPDRPGTFMLGAGQYHWLVESDYYQTSEFNDVWPPAKLYDRTADLKLVPAPAYPFPEPVLEQPDLIVTLVRGTLFNAGGEPVEGVPIELTAPVLPPRFEGFVKCLTNKRGEWLLCFIEKERRDPVDPVPDFPNSRIHVGLPGAAAYDISPLEIKPGQENSVRQTALRGGVIKPGGVPLAGVKITTSVAAGEAISKSDGRWFFYFELKQAAAAVTVTATTPDGLTNTAQTQIVPGRTVVVPAIELS